ncbi:hypothetical protein ACROYT_G044780 [Oculina patagonica]
MKDLNQSSNGQGEDIGQRQTKRQEGFQTRLLMNHLEPTTSHGSPGKSTVTLSEAVITDTSNEPVCTKTDNIDDTIPYNEGDDKFKNVVFRLGTMAEQNISHHHFQMSCLLRIKEGGSTPLRSRSAVIGSELDRFDAIT